MAKNSNETLDNPLFCLRLFLLPGSVGIIMQPPLHSPRARIWVCVYIRKGDTYLGVLNEPVGRELAGREHRLAEGGCEMRCGAVAC